MFWNNKQKLNIEKTLKNRDRDLNFTPFLKLYYKYPEKHVKFEGQSKEYYSFNDMLIDFRFRYIFTNTIKRRTKKKIDRNKKINLIFFYSKNIYFCIIKH